MKNFMQNRWKSCGIFLFFSLQTIVVFAMNLFVLSNETSLKPRKTISIFDSKTALESRMPWGDVVPGAVIVTPDGKGVVISERGRVRRAHFDSMDDCSPETIIEHARVKHSPMITMAQKKDGSLLIVSAGNYTNQEKKCVSEYILFCDGLSKVKKLEGPIQALSLDSAGEKLTIAGKLSVMVVDLETDKNTMAFFKHNNRENWIVDIAMNPKGKEIIVVGDQRGVQWMSLSKEDEGDINLSNLKQVVSKDNIKKIYYPNAEELLYLTLDGKAKIINIKNDLLEPSGEEMNQTTDFSHSLLYNMVSADPSEHVATAHWTNDTKVATRHKIKIYRKSNEYVEKFILEVPELERYNYITALGQCGSGIGYLLDVALYDNRVVALATDGKLRVWFLPEKNVVSNKVDENKQKFYEKLKELKSIDKEEENLNVTPRKRRANSESKNSKHTLKITPVGTIEPVGPRKVSPRIQIFKALSGHSSKDDSPSNTPPLSPQGNDKQKNKTTKDHEDNKI